MKQLNKTKAIILAAGEGQRLRPLTVDRPKCMVEYKNRPIIDYICDTFQRCGINDISVVTGYRSEMLKAHLEGRVNKTFNNSLFNQTNMVESLFCAVDEMDSDLIISYSDIIYNDQVLKLLINSDAPVSVVVDNNWLELWNTRMEDPLSDAESMKIDANNNIIELGKKPNNLAEIQGQYIGLIKIKKSFLSPLIKFYNNLDRSITYDGKDFPNMYMTSFIQLIIEHLSPVEATQINGGWLEIDTIEDLNAYSSSPIDFLNKQK